MKTFPISRCVFHFCHFLHNHKKTPGKPEVFFVIITKESVLFVSQTKISVSCLFHFLFFNKKRFACHVCRLFHSHKLDQCRNDICQASALTQCIFRICVYEDKWYRVCGMCSPTVHLSRSRSAVLHYHGQHR